MRQNNKTEKSSNELKENTQAMREQNSELSHPCTKTELKTPTREPKKSVLEPIES
ncbi:hypothetical protein [Helicobacter pylori]|uniref:hypothetical protein n=1 Tax=Helicobacter pylori TaxID=210 RepID=UPI0013DE3FA5|nr:hypothetical protein [Helicobacter pylori]MCQ2781099.1 hypothetical protein [Helicobacter pylori]MDZ5287549.1 hypothetical protein [Helicobacter pylori]WRC99804.1 hypothetical protein E5K75_07095 [Helicobacter pylori]